MRYYIASINTRRYTEESEDCLTHDIYIRNIAKTRMNNSGIRSATQPTNEKEIQL